MWFREYVFNVLIQPFHLLIYTILVGSAMTLAQSNMIYAIVAIGFLIPAEKLLRKFFGFDNAGTLSAAGSFAGGAMFSAAINRLNKGSGSGGSGSGNSGKEGSRPVRKANSRAGLVDADNTLIGGSGGANAGLAAPVRTLGGNPGGGNPGGGNPGGGNPGGGNPGGGNPGGGNPGGGNPGGGNPGGGNPGGGNPGGGNPGGGNPGGGNPGGGNPGGGNPGGGNPGGGNGGTVPNGQALRSGVFGPAGNSLGARFTRLGNRVGRATQGLGTRVANASRSAGYRAYNKAITGVKSLPKTAGRWTRKALVGGTIGGGLALAGAAVGIASGDPSAAFKYGLAGGAAGYYGANKLGNKATDELADLAKGARTSFWGSDMKDIETAKFDREFVNSPENRDALTKALGSRSAVMEAINDGSVQALLNNGITDPTKIGKALKLRNNLMAGTRDANGNIVRQPINNPDEALRQAVATAKWNRDVSASVYDPMSRAREVFEERLFRQIRAADTTGMSDNQITERVNNILSDMASFET